MINILRTLFYILLLSGPYGCGNTQIPHRSSPLPPQILDLNTVFAHWPHPSVGDCLSKLIHTLNFPHSSHKRISPQNIHLSINPQVTHPSFQALYQCSNTLQFQMHSSLKKHQTLLAYQDVQAPYLNQNSSLTHHFVFWKSSQDQTPFNLLTLFQVFARSLPPSTQVSLSLIKIRRFPSLHSLQHRIHSLHKKKPFSFLLNSVSSLPSQMLSLSGASYLITLTFTHTLPSLHHLAWWVHLNPILVSFIDHPMFSTLSRPFFQQFHLTSPPHLIQSRSSSSHPFKSLSTPLEMNSFNARTSKTSIIQSEIYQNFNTHQPYLKFSSFSSWSQLTHWLWDRFFQPNTDRVPSGLNHRLLSNQSFPSKGSSMHSLLISLHQILHNQIKYITRFLNKYTPQSPLSTWTAQQGDCKDLSKLAYHILSSRFPLYFAFTSTSPLSPLSPHKRRVCAHRTGPQIVPLRPSPSCALSAPPRTHRHYSSPAA